MLPKKRYKGEKFNYPLGISDFQRLFNKDADIESFKEIPQYIYMGALDENDAVQFDDAYDHDERKIINTLMANTVQPRWEEIQRIYKEENVSAQFKTIEEVGHWTTGPMNLEVIKFFLRNSAP